MKLTRRYFFLAALCWGQLLLAQAPSWQLHLNMNEYYPLNAQLKGYYPMLWYSSTEGRGVLLGGFGGGVSYRRPLGKRGKWALKSQLNLSRVRYYDDPVLFTNEDGQQLGASIGITTNLNLTALCLPKYTLTKWLDAGVGLGLQGRILGRSDYGKAIIQGEERKLKFTNKSTQPLLLLLPVELTAQRKRFSFSSRFEFSLTRVSQLKYAAKQGSMTLFLELGYRLGAPKPAPASAPVIRN